jgi:hypothetical protein
MSEPSELAKRVEGVLACVRRPVDRLEAAERERDDVGAYLKANGAEGETLVDLVDDILDMRGVCMVCNTRDAGDTFQSLKRERDEAKAEARKWQRIRKPTHGPCCTCQGCGQHYDDCRCDLDVVADELEQAKRQLAKANEQLENQSEAASQAAQEYVDLEATLTTFQARYERLREVIELPLLFYAGGKPNWNRWEEITGSRYVTTRIMCDAIRAALNDKGEKDEESKPV